RLVALLCRPVRGVVRQRAADAAPARALRAPLGVAVGDPFGALRPAVHLCELDAQALDLGAGVVERGEGGVERGEERAYVTCLGARAPRLRSVAGPARPDRLDLSVVGGHALSFARRARHAASRCSPSNASASSSARNAAARSGPEPVTSMWAR